MVYNETVSREQLVLAVSPVANESKIERFYRLGTVESVDLSNDNHPGKTSMLLRLR